MCLRFHKRREINGKFELYSGLVQRRA